MAEFPKGTVRAWLRIAIKDLLLLATFSGAVLAGLQTDYARSWVMRTFDLVEPSGGPCTTIPAHGHFITPEASPGDWASVEWRDVVRHRPDCGLPEVSAIVTNGGGFYHDAPLSITGVMLPVGASNVSYRFFLREELSAGPARFRVTVTFPDANGGAPPAVSPWLPFTIVQEGPQ